MGYKQQMVRFINGEHSAPLLSPRAILSTWVLFASSVAQTGFLPSPELLNLKCVHAVLSHPLPPASLLEIPLWRWQYPDSPVQLHFKDLITPVDTRRFFLPQDSPGFYLCDWLPGSGLITDLIDMVFRIPSSSVSPCPSVSSYLRGGVSRIRGIPVKRSA